MRILFAIGIAVSALLLASCSNPDTSGGVTMQKDVGDGHPSNWPFPHGSCGGRSHEYRFAETNTGCGWITVDENTYLIRPHVDLPKANLRSANLRGAYLNWAYLVGADLRNADLRSAYLINADLLYASLQGADLSGAIVNNSLGESAVTGAIGNPSTICPNGKKWRTAGNNCGF
jgi:hypothetical protein